MRILLVIVACQLLSAYAGKLKLAQKINSLNLHWKANEDISIKTQHTYKSKATPRSHLRMYEENKELPISFDSREQWPNCPTIRMVRDQGDCGSCWAFGSAEAMSDRTCIHSNAKYTPELSADQINSCCFYCGNGCDGGDASMAYEYWIETGVVTGGPYGSDKPQTCRPYQIPQCAHHVNSTSLPPCGKGVRPTPRCERKCVSTFTGGSFGNAKFYGARVYSLQNATQMQYDLMQNGPITVCFTVYADFELYKSGVYKHTSGAELGGHCVKIIGWGVDDGIDYWLIANSWNVQWGEKGFVKFIRGINDCGIESGNVAGIPR